MQQRNRRIVLAARPVGEPKPELKAACPLGVDIYFENVGGKVFQAVLPLLKPFARVPVCGLIAHYNATELPPCPDRVPAVMAAILVKRLMFRGFIVRELVLRSEPPGYADASTCVWLWEVHSSTHNESRLAACPLSGVPGRVRIPLN